MKLLTHAKLWCTTLLFAALFATANADAQIIISSTGDTLVTISNDVFAQPGGVALFSIDSNGNVLDIGSDTIAHLNSNGVITDVNNDVIGTLSSNSFSDAGGDVLGECLTSGVVKEFDGTLLGEFDGIPALHAAYYFFIYIE